MIRNTILFGKYQLLRETGSGRTGTVWLALHLGLEEYRAIKQVSKVHRDYETFRREALILKELKHPGIPLIYDLEEDLNYFYIIEEYLEGYSLYALVKNQGVLQETDALRYGVQICSLVEYMHSAYEEPILHLDLQPNNLMICSDTVRLIDFDHAAHVMEANTCAKRYGTLGCAAPEQYTSDQLLDPRTDVYAIGAVLRFMICKTQSQDHKLPCAVSEALKAFIRKCMDPDKEKRYSSAKEAGDILQRLLAGAEPVNNHFKAIPSLSIVLAGSRHGAGTTHLALGLCFYLTRQGYQVLYEEQNQSGAMRAMVLKERTRADQYGIYQMNGCQIRPWYGPAVKLEKPEGFSITIKDYGTQWTDAGRELKAGQSIWIGLCCQSPWERGQPEQMIKGLGMLKATAPGVLVVRYKKKGFFKLSGLSENCLKQKPSFSVFCTPEYESPFKQDTEIRSFMQEIWKKISEGSCFGGNHGRKKGMRRSGLLELLGSEGGQE